MYNGFLICFSQVRAQTAYIFLVVIYFQHKHGIFNTIFSSTYSEKLILRDLTKVCKMAQTFINSSHRVSASVYKSLRCPSVCQLMYCDIKISEFQHRPGQKRLHDR